MFKFGTIHCSVYGNCVPCCSLHEIRINSCPRIIVRIAVRHIRLYGTVPFVRITSCENTTFHRRVVKVMSNSEPFTFKHSTFRFSFRPGPRRPSRVVKGCVHCFRTRTPTNTDACGAAVLSFTYGVPVRIVPASASCRHALCLCHFCGLGTRCLGLGTRCLSGVIVMSPPKPRQLRTATATAVTFALVLHSALLRVSSNAAVLSS